MPAKVKPEPTLEELVAKIIFEARQDGARSMRERAVSMLESRRIPIQEWWDLRNLPLIATERTRLRCRRM